MKGTLRLFPFFPIFGDVAGNGGGMPYLPPHCHNVSAFLLYTPMPLMSTFMVTFSNNLFVINLRNVLHQTNCFLFKIRASGLKTKEMFVVG